MIRLLFLTILFVCVAAGMIAALQDSTLPAIETSPGFTSGSARVTTAEEAGSSNGTLVRTSVRGTLVSSRTGSMPASIPAPPSASAAFEAGRPARYVLTEGTPVYSRNSGDGEVLTLLGEGAPLETGVGVLAPDGWWIEVKLDGKSGFIRSDHVGRN